jgi:sister chromatid cohesion protein DCC1
LLVVTPPPDTALEFSEDVVVIRDQVNEILELTPTVPRIQKLVSLLRGREYDETNEDDVVDDELAAAPDSEEVCTPPHSFHYATRQNDTNRSLFFFSVQTLRYTYKQAREEIQASDAELDECLRRKRILNIQSA